MRIRLTLAIAAFAAMMSASAAGAVDLCRLAAARDFAAASAAMEAGGCSVKEEAGLTFRSFNCPKDLTAAIDAQDGSLSVILPIWAADTLDVKCDGRAWTEVRSPYDNPLILKLLATDASYRAARVTVLGMDPVTPYLLWVCLEGYNCRGGFDDKLTAVLKLFLDAGVLNYEPSLMRVAGLDITRAKRDEFERALVERGGVAGERDGNDLVKRVTFEKVTGVPGLGVVQVMYLADGIVSVRYAIRAQSDYQAFSQSLDSRYGASSPTSEKGCVSRLWRDGGASILGEFCATRPLESGFTFFNKGALDIASGANQFIETSSESEKVKPRPPEKPKAKTDMY